MTINDEMLSAYLDNELSEHDRALVQASLRDNKAAADRLAQLASVDALIGQQAALIDQMPMPASVLAMLGAAPAPAASSRSTNSNVVELSRFRQARQRVMQVVREHAALAASLALLLGFAGGQMMPTSGGDAGANDSNAAFFAALDTLPSGQQLAVDSATSLTARFSFQDTQARFCRQYQVQDAQGSSENLACREQDQWTLVASIRSSAVPATAQYQTASGPRLLDSMLDTMMQGSALSQAEEQAAIGQGWQAE